MPDDDKLFAAVVFIKRVAYPEEIACRLLFLRRINARMDKEDALFFIECTKIERTSFHKLDELFCRLFPHRTELVIGRPPTI